MFEARIVPGILKLEADVRKIPRYPLAYRTDATSISAGMSDSDESVIKYSVGDIGSPNISRGGKVFYPINDSTLYYERPVGKFTTMKLELTYSKEQAGIRVNKAYHRLGRMSIETVHSAGRHLRDLTNLRLLEQGRALLHGAAFSYNGRTAVLIGLSNTGKTTTTLDFVKNLGAQYIAEDLLVTNGEQVYTCPLTKSNLNPTQVDKTSYKVYERLRRTIPLLENIYEGPLASAGDVIPDEQFVSEQKVTDIFIMSKDTTPSTENISPEKAAKLLISSNHAEFTHNTSQIMWAAQYLGLDIDTDALLQRERTILQNMVEGKEIHYLKGDPSYFRTVIEETLS